MTGLFTVEQIELIRRLKNTGITSQQVVEAFDSLSKMESELGSQSSPVQSSSSATTTPTSSRTNGHGPPTSSAPVPAPFSLPGFDHSHAAAAAAMISGSRLLEAMQCMSGAANGFGLDTPNGGRGPHMGEWKLENGGRSQTPNSFSLESSPSANGSMVPDFVADVEPEELEEFNRKTEDDILEEIRKFVAQHQLRQQNVALMTKISQPYVSKFLRGEGRDISHRVKQAMYMWFLTCKKFPWKMAPYRSEHSLRPTIMESGEVVIPRRERFVFRPLHVQILEAFYAVDPYPDQQKREEIAAACNQALAKERGVADGHLNEKEMVHAQVVANWFANKRKEHKKQLGGLPFPHGYHPYGRRGRKPAISGYASLGYPPTMAPHLLPGGGAIKQEPLGVGGGGDCSLSSPADSQDYDDDEDEMMLDYGRMSEDSPETVGCLNGISALEGEERPPSSCHSASTHVPLNGTNGGGPPTLGCRPVATVGDSS